MFRLLVILGVFLAPINCMETSPQTLRTASSPHALLSGGIFKDENSSSVPKSNSGETEPGSGPTGSYDLPWLHQSPLPPMFDIHGNRYDNRMTRYPGYTSAINPTINGIDENKFLNVDNRLHEDPRYRQTAYDRPNYSLNQYSAADPNSIQDEYRNGRNQYGPYATAPQIYQGRNWQDSIDSRQPNDPYNRQSDARMFTPQGVFWNSPNRYWNAPTAYRPNQGRYWENNGAIYRRPTTYRAANYWRPNPYETDNQRYRSDYPFSNTAPIQFVNNN